jgi:hypothetical protein
MGELAKGYFLVFIQKTFTHGVVNKDIFWCLAKKRLFMRLAKIYFVFI